MTAALTTFLSPSSSWAQLPWYSATVLNSWLNHTFAVALPLFMMAARRLKPQKNYVLPVLGCVFLYFTVAAGVSWLLILKGVITRENSFSFIFSTDGIPFFELLYRLIPLPYFYLYPLLLLLAAIFTCLRKFLKGGVHSRFPCAFATHLKKIHKKALPCGGAFSF